MYFDTMYPLRLLIWVRLPMTLIPRPHELAEGFMIYIELKLDISRS